MSFALMVLAAAGEGMRSHPAWESKTAIRPSPALRAIASASA